MGRKMIHTYLRDRSYSTLQKLKHPSQLISSLIQSRNLSAIQTVDYRAMTVTSLDIDDAHNFVLVGLSNGLVDLQEIHDPAYGKVSQLARFNFGQSNVNRVQWNPANGEQFFSILDNRALHIVDPVGMQAVENFEFNMKANWSEWNVNDRKMIAVCGSESQVRLVDIRSGSSAQTVILGAASGLASHRATRCLWSKHDTNCLIVGDNEGYVHVYDTRQSTKPQLLANEERGQISGMSFAADQCSIITSQGTENSLVEWVYDKCRLVPHPKKFRKPGRRQVFRAVRSSCEKARETCSHCTKGTMKQRRRHIHLPVSAYIRCQFHVADGHVFCPVPSSSKKSKEIYIYDLKSGLRTKTVKSDDILSQGIYAVSSLLPESLVIYVGGRGRLRVWTVDEGHQLMLAEKLKHYHSNQWDSEDEA